MTENWTDLSGRLTSVYIKSSAPTRLSCGGSTDHRLAGLVCRPWGPATVNIAIDLRAHVELRPHLPGRISVDIEGVGEKEFAVPALPLKGPFALVSALACYFGVHGFRVEIRTKFPFQSGLGGSGAVSIALIGAIRAALEDEAPGPREHDSLVRLAHNIEDSLFGNTGMQDQAAAVYGGVNLWEWDYSSVLDLVRRPIPINPSSLREHVLLGYPGSPHPESRKGSKILDSFKENSALDTFASISETAREFARCLESEDYAGAGECVSAEFELRSSLIRVLRPDDAELVELAGASDCGVGVTGHGGGGCLWAIGEKERIDNLREKWIEAFARRGAGHLLPFDIAEDGLKVSLVAMQSREEGK